MRFSFVIAAMTLLLAVSGCVFERQPEPVEEPGGPGVEAVVATGPGADNDELRRGRPRNFAVRNQVVGFYRHRVAIPQIVNLVCQSVGADI